MGRHSSAGVLFVCTGNVCRSPFAEGLAKVLVSELPDHHPAHSLRFSSAGVGALAGHQMCPEMAAELVNRGGTTDGFEARQITAAVARDADLILTLEASHRDYILEEWPGVVRRTFLLGQIARVVPTLTVESPLSLMHTVRGYRGVASPQDSIDDPFRRGPEAAARAAEAIEAALRALLR